MHGIWGTVEAYLALGLKHVKLKGSVPDGFWLFKGTKNMAQSYESMGYDRIRKTLKEDVQKYRKSRRFFFMSPALSPVLILIIEG